jgi:hypothetical protein
MSRVRSPAAALSSALAKGASSLKAASVKLARPLPRGGMGGGGGEDGATQQAYPTLTHALYAILWHNWRYPAATAAGGGANTASPRVGVVAAAAGPTAAPLTTPRATGDPVWAYPGSVNLANFLAYSFSPTLVYAPNYPRTPRVRPAYILEKFFLACGLLMTGLFIIDAYITPTLREMPRVDPLEAVIRILVPFTALLLICFFVVFECVLVSSRGASRSAATQPAGCGGAGGGRGVAGRSGMAG